MLNNFLSSSVLPATDINRAKEFYKTKLGLEIIKEMDGMFLVKTGGDTRILVYVTAPSKAEHTQLGLKIAREIPLR
ncbi:MAG: VOC family protein [Candidatus Dojkabacteria bacterium]